MKNINFWINELLNDSSMKPAEEFTDMIQYDLSMLDAEFQIAFSGSHYASL